MELASMLAGERFNDHPQSVCPVIGAVLRAYNDCVDDGRRQALIPIAALVVGSRRDGDTERARITALQEWCRRRWSRRRWWRRPPAAVELAPTPASYHVYARAAMKTLDAPITEGDHEAVVALIRRLTSIGAASAPEMVVAHEAAIAS